MIEQYLYKFVFSNENGTIANVVACAPKNVSESDIFEKVSKEVTSNYCDDNHYPYSNEFVMNMMDYTSVQKLGTFRPDNDDFCNDDFTIITLNKTKHWRNG